MLPCHILAPWQVQEPLVRGEEVCAGGNAVFSSARKGRRLRGSESERPDPNGLFIYYYFFKIPEGQTV